MNARLARYRTDRAVIYEVTHRPTSEQIGERVLEEMQDIARAQAPVTLRDFMSPGAWADRQAKHAAVRVVLANYEPSMVATDELLDDLIAAADTGI
jgi:hypothetical protein